jgi:hypothetical protein
MTLEMSGIIMGKPTKGRGSDISSQLMSFSVWFLLSLVATGGRIYPVSGDMTRIGPIEAFGFPMRSSQIRHNSRHVDTVLTKPRTAVVGRPTINRLVSTRIFGESGDNDDMTHDEKEDSMVPASLLNESDGPSLVRKAVGQVLLFLSLLGGYIQILVGGLLTLGILLNIFGYAYQVRDCPVGPHPVAHSRF